jgi:hypothetical protein
MRTLIILLFFTTTTVYTQNINWTSLTPETKQILYFNTGYDFGMTAQVGYGYKIKTIKPLWLTLDYALPMGKNLLDDFKVKGGGQMAVIEKNNFLVTAKAYAIFRRHQNNYVRMISFGTEFSASVGYYQAKWHVAGDFGFDKSINTHLKHTEIMLNNNPEIKDGWFIPSGGHFHYGVQGSKSLGKKCDLSLKLGGTNAQGKDQNALLPYYAQLGLSWEL